MAKGTLLKKLETTSSKAEEIQHLMKFVSTLGEGTYLKSLFSPALLEWVQNQMAMDFSCDLYDWVDMDGKKSRELQKALDDQRYELNEAESAIKHRDAKIAILEDEIRVLRNQIKDNNQYWQEKCNQKAVKIQEYAEVIDEQNKVLNALHVIKKYLV